MKNQFSFYVVLSVLILNVMTLKAQDASLVAVPEDDGALMIKVSDNGRWAAGYFTSESVYMGASIWNLETYERIRLVPEGQSASAFDVTDDGSVAVGTYNNKPAYCQNGIWTELPMPVAGGIGEVWGVTPDGSKMVGKVFSSDWSAGYACLWVNGELTQVNHASADRFGDNAYFNEMVGISADGNTMLGCLNYVVLPNRTAFLIKNGEYFMFGAENYDPLQGGSTYNFYDVLSMSPNGKWVTGDIYWVEEMWVSEYFCPFRYDVENDITELFLDYPETASFAVDDAGNLFGANPLNFPIRDAYILKNGSWVLLDQEILTEYGLDVMAETGYSKLSNVFSVSADGKTIVGVNGMNTFNWVLKLPQPVGGNEMTPVAAEMKAEVRGSKLLMQGKIAHVSIVNSLGNLVLDQDIKMPIIDLSNFASGMYVVTMRDIYGNQKSNKVMVRGY